MRLLLVLLFFTFLCLGEPGIAGLKKWLKVAYPGALKPIPAKCTGMLFDHVCIDMNQILHVAVRKSRNDEHAIVRTFKEVGRLLDTCEPRKSVVFALDGCAPMAKLVTQRHRRENTKVGKKGMSTLHLTPGTPLMIKFQEALRYFAYTRVRSQRFADVRFFISGAEIQGEGELKIVDWVNLTQREGSKDSIVIVGGDSDLILQGLALLKVKNLFIFDSRPSESSLVSVQGMVQILDAQCPGMSAALRLDLVLLLVLNGNDYLPKMRGMSFERATQEYHRMRQSAEHGKHFALDTAQRSFNWDFMQAFFERTSRLSSGFDRGDDFVTLSAAQELNVAWDRGFLGDDCEDKPEYEITSVPSDPNRWIGSVLVGGKVFSSGQGPEGQGYRSGTEAKAAAALNALKEIRPDLHHVFVSAVETQKEQHRQAQEMARLTPGGREKTYNVEAYLEGLLWNIQMYIDGCPGNYYWRYNEKRAPSCAEVVEWIEENRDRLARSSPITPPMSDQAPVSASVACLAMMPREGQPFLPEALARLMDDDSPIAGFWPPEEDPNAAEPVPLSEPGPPARNPFEDFSLESIVSATREASVELSVAATPVWTVVQRRLSKETTPWAGPPLRLLRSVAPPLAPVSKWSKAPHYPKTLQFPATTTAPCRPWSSTDV